MAHEDTDPITFVVAGQNLPGGVSAGTLRGAEPAGRGMPGRVKAAVRVGALRAAGEPQRLVAVPGEDIVALHVAGGPVLMLHPATARDLILAQSGAAVTRGAETGEIVVGAQLRWKGLEEGTPTRGMLGDVVLAAVEVLTGYAKDKVVDWAASAVVKKVDGQVDAGVYALAPEALPKLMGSGRKVPGRLPASGQPVLVFIHGTFVESTSTFGKLWALHPQRVRQLFDHYGGRVYALEHETLGKSPIANALTLARALPDGAKLHLVTHSRGGLVAEVLARVAALVGQGGLTGADLSFFARPEYAPQRAELEELAALLKGRGIEILRVVRVACPARGTLLASKRLDAYLSVLKWSIEATGVPLVPEFVDFLSEVARQRADPEAIPGLAAMIPETPLVNWLNAAPAPIPGELRVVAGDLEGDSIGSWIKTLLTDAYYWTDNDIVVQTRSMYAGAPRAGGASFLLDQGGKTTHFAYFANPRTVDAVVDALVQPRPPEGFEPIGPLSWAGKDAGGLRGLERDPDKPAVFVLPGILGSNLKLEEGDERIWLGPRLIGGLALLSYQPDGADGVRPDGPIGLVYDKLIDHLGATHEVRPFDFDWRRPIEEEARRLADAVEDALDARKQTRQPVRLLAHSMGGLVARTMQIERPSTWARLMAHPDARLVMLGTPNGGSYAPMQVLSGDDTFGNALAAFGSPLQDRKAREIMAAMPGFLQLQAGLDDPQSKLRLHDEWDRLAKADYARLQQNNWWHRHAGEAMEAAYQWGVPSQRVLDRAIALRAALDQQRDKVLPAFAAKLCLVVGHARSTPVGYEERPDGFFYLDAGDGDGRVPLQSALLPGVKTWKLDCEHGSLPSAKGAFDAFVELLDKGATDKLETWTPTRGSTDTGTLRRSRPSRQRQSARPARSEASVFGQAGMTDPAAQTTAGASLQVRVLNGNLCFVGQPLVVGHYRSTELTGTEAAVDRMLGGTMKAALSAGLYPDERGSHQVFVNSHRDPQNPWRDPRPQAVIVVGLGDEGGLREIELVAGVRRGVLAWGQRLAEDREHGSASTELAATLLGSGGLGVSAASAARAIARGVREANLLLGDIGWPTVSRLTLVELFLERAVEAWQGLQVLAASSPEAFRVEAQIPFGTGPIRRQLTGGYRGTDYDLITAVVPRQGLLEFALDSRRARTELRSQPTQIGLVRDLVAKASTHRNDDPTIGRTLFQLLVPAEIEPFLGGTDRMVLDLDASAAAVPWELLDAGEVGGGRDRRPWAVRAQLLRRLRKTSFRAAPRDANAEDHVLVIGEPLLDPGAPYAALPAAREEAEAVQEALTGAGGLPFERVLALLDKPDATTVVGALLARRWRIVHIAGHGESHKDGGRGVVLSGGHFLGVNEIKAMRTVPELVFINCCHLASFRNEQVLRGFDPTAFAAGVADELIGIGVRCVIASGWAVEDGPAHEFARRFYRELVGGARFVDAVAAAREACWMAAPLGKTWAAYQCYGDPNWVFSDAVGDSQQPRARNDEFAAIATPVGLALVLETIEIESRFMGKAPEGQQARLRQLETRFGDLWGHMGAVAEVFGTAWEAAGDRRQAIAWLTRAVKASDASASMKADETLQNLSAREAWNRAAKHAARQAEGGARSKDADAAVGKALARLTVLADTRPTAERLNLLGSAHKRLGLIERQAGNAAGQRRSLQAALAAYRRAIRLGVKAGVPDVFYPALNCMALDLVLDLLAGRRPAFAAANRQAARSSLAAKSRQDPDFWSQVGLVEYDLYSALAAGRLAAEAPTLARAWADVRARVDSPGWWSSVADQADLVLGAWVHHGREQDREPARALWRQLHGYTRKDETLIEQLTAAPSAAVELSAVTAKRPAPTRAEPPVRARPYEAAAVAPAATRGRIEASVESSPMPASAGAEPPGPAPEPASLPASASRTMPTAEAEPVDAAVFCPPRVARASTFLVQVFLYPPPQADEVAARAREADAAAERRQSWSLPLDLAPGTRVDLRLEMPGLSVAEPDAFVVWRRRAASVQFEVGVPADAAGDASGNAIGRVRFAIDGVPVGTMRFQVAIVAVGAPAEAAAPRATEAERYRQAFVSYASKDRAEVLRRVQAFKIAGLKVFQDVLELDPGERWEKRLYTEIDRCDVFLLFWSNAARESPWVGKEIDYALARKGGRDERPPAIQPVPIEGPPIVKPPESLRDLHFNDALLPHIAAADASRPPPAASPAAPRQP